MAAPRKLNDDIIQRIAESVRRGCTLDEAAESGGVTRSAVSKWLAKGDADLAAGKESLEAILFGLVQDARAEWRSARLDKIAGSKDWRAHAWALERELKVRLGGARIAQLKAQTEWLRLRSAERQTLLERLRMASDDELKAAIQEFLAREASGDAGAAPEEPPGDE